MNYETVIGLEVHAHLATGSKLFCGCANKAGEPPNTLTCPVCLGLPGVLPVVNREALRLGTKTALALECAVAPSLRFDRKNYFYPDLPKNFQISQFALPIGAGGRLGFALEDGTLKTVRIRRVHLEEDAGKLVHEENASLVDYNRTGVPLLEIVSEPDLSSPREAFLYLRALKAVLEYLEVSDCDMEKGNLRCDANVSLREAGASGLGVKAEIKNLNSFRAVEKALAFEKERQTEALANGEKIVQETRLWDENAGITAPMRTKEESHDYRYFPEPDLPPFTVGKEEVKAIGKTLPELPRQRQERFGEQYRLAPADAAFLISEKFLADYFEEAVAAYPDAKKTANWIMGPVQETLNERKTTAGDFRRLVPPANLAGLLRLIDDGSVSGKLAKEQIFPEMLTGGKDAKTVVAEKGLAQISDQAELEKIAEKIIADNPKPVADYRSGNANAIMFLVGQVMKASKGKANPQLVTKLLKEKMK